YSDRFKGSLIVLERYLGALEISLLEFNRLLAVWFFRGSFIGQMYSGLFDRFRGNVRTFCRFGKVFFWVRLRELRLGQVRLGYVRCAYVTLVRLVIFEVVGVVRPPKLVTLARLVGYVTLVWTRHGYVRHATLAWLDEVRLVLYLVRVRFGVRLGKDGHATIAWLGNFLSSQDRLGFILVWFECLESQPSKLLGNGYIGRLVLGSVRFSVKVEATLARCDEVELDWVTLDLVNFARL
ncbi:hypothetical protein L9F63_000876, partial [Diploptera punctata]